MGAGKVRRKKHRKETHEWTRRTVSASEAWSNHAGYRNGRLKIELHG